MCFEFLHPVSSVILPDYTDEFRVFDTGVPVSAEDVVHQITTASKIALDNAIIGRVLMEVGVNYTETTVLTGDEVIQELEDRSVVFTTPLESANFLQGRVHEEVLMVTHDVRLQGTTVVLKLKDFSFVAMYSLIFTAPEALPKGVLGLATLSVKFGIEAESINAYVRYTGVLPGQENR